MATDTGPQPDTCQYCGSQKGFTVREVRFEYDKQSEIGSFHVTETLRAKVTTWECNACQSLTSVSRDVA